MTIRKILEKIYDNFVLDSQFLRVAGLDLLKKVSFIVNKYIAITLNKRTIYYLGRKLYYDNRFTPALLQSYPDEIINLNRYMDFEKINTVFDIGGNIGQFGFTLKTLFPHVSVYSFEPNTLVTPLLKVNAQNFKQWKVFEYGIGNNPSSQDFYFIKGKSGQGSFEKVYASENLTGKISKIKVKTIPLTKSNISKLRLPEKVDFVKIDVEGSEYSVIKTLSGITPKYIYFEYRISSNKLKNIKKVMSSRWGRVELIMKNGKKDIQNLLYKVG